MRTASLPLTIAECAAASCGPSGASATCYGGSENIGVQTVVVAELRLSDVQRQILGAHLVIGADDAALEQAPESFNGVGVNCANNVLTSAMIHHAMREFFGNGLVSLPCICADQADAIRNAFADEGDEAVRTYAFDNARNDLAFALDCTDYNRLTGADAATRTARAFSIATATLIFVLVLRLAADERLIDFHNTHELLKLGVHHGAADFVAHAQGRLVGAETHIPLNLQCANTFLAGQHQVNDAEPFAQALIGVLEDGSHKHGEAVGATLAAVRAFPLEGHGGQLVDTHRGAPRAADHSIRPAVIPQEGFARII